MTGQISLLSKDDAYLIIFFAPLRGKNHGALALHKIASSTLVNDQIGVLIQATE
jgi:hypothetical protein